MKKRVPHFPIESKQSTWIPFANVFVIFKGDINLTSTDEIHIETSLTNLVEVSFFNYFMSVTAGGTVTPRGHMYASAAVGFGWFVAFEIIDIFRVKIEWNSNFVGLLHHPKGFSLFWYFWDISFKLLKLLFLAKDHWWSFSTRIAQMVHFVILIRFKIVYTSL